MPSSAPNARLQALLRIAALRSDLSLAALSQARQACSRTEDQLRALTLPETPADLPPLQAARQSLLYEQWAEPKRIHLNTRLAAERAQAAERQSQAEQDFGRLSVLTKLCRRS